MAGVAVETNTLAITGLDNDITLTNEKTLTVPVMDQGGKTILTTATTTALQLFDLVDHFALNKIYAVFIKAVVGTVWIKPNTAGTTTFGSAGATLELKVGRSTIVAVNPANNAGMTIDGDTVAAAIRWHILAKA